MPAAVAAENERRVGPEQLVLLAAAVLISACGLVYELVAGALASYLIGDTLTRFSTVIGAYLFAMGIGAVAILLFGGYTFIQHLIFMVIYNAIFSTNCGTKTFTIII